MAELKGAILRGVMRDAKETIRGGIPAMMSKLAPEILEVHFSRNILHGMWYKYEAFAALLDAFSQALSYSNPESFQKLGARMAERDMTTLLKVYAMVASPSKLADVPRKIWVQRFRDAGSAKSESGDNFFRFTITGFPQIHPMHCEILTGYGSATGRQKSSDFTSCHDRCVHRGDSECSYLSQW